MQRIVDSADIFGPENVIPNFVAGVEMAQPAGYKDLHAAVACRSICNTSLCGRAISDKSSDITVQAARNVTGENTTND